MLSIAITVGIMAGAVYGALYIFRQLRAMGKLQSEEEQREHLVRLTHKAYWISGALLIWDIDTLAVETILVIAVLLWLLLLSEGSRATTIRVFRHTAWLVATVGSARALGIV